jgi:hypothetical protein
MQIHFAEKARLSFGRTTKYVGRNGAGQQHGLEIWEMNESVMLTPINSKEYLAHCSMEIPRNGDILKAVAGELLRIAAGLGDAAEEVTIAIVLEGGIVQAVVSDAPDTFRGVRTLVVDYDTEGMTRAEVTPVRQGDGSVSTAWVYSQEIGDAEIDLSGI